MLLWLIFGVMTAAAIAAVLVPLVRGRVEVPSNPDIAVYRDQLDEVDRDVSAGLIGNKEAEAARVEISRRLLAAADYAGATALDSASAKGFRPYFVAAALLLLPAGAAALYLKLGSPELTVTSAAGIVQSENSTDIENLIARVEAHLQKNPEDGRGWEVLAPVYMQVGRYSDSASAWRRTLALLGESADRQANLGEALMAEANGVVTVAAKAAFIRSVTLDNSIVSARYYLGRAAEQDGKRDEAAQIWRDLIAGAPAGAHWVKDVRAALDRIESNSAAAASSTGAQIAAPIDQPSGQQQAATTRGMSAGSPPSQHDGDAIQGTINRLAERLKTSGSDPEGWVMLTRSYASLGEKEKAAEAIRDARAALAGDEARLQVFNEALQRFKIDDLAKQASTLPGAPTDEPRPPVQGGNQTDEMIRGMVARLAERMKKDGADLDGWQQLMRSYLVLGQRDKALSAAADARRNIGSDGDRRQRLDDFIKSLGLDG